MAASNVQMDYIWGDDDETQTFAHAHDGKGAGLIFRILRDGRRPKSLASRIVACFHELPVASSSETFQDRSEMRKVLDESIRLAWPDCAHASKVPSTIVDLVCEDEDRMDWRMQDEPELYQQYLSSLLEANHVSVSHPTERGCEFVDQGDLIMIERLPGRGASAVVMRRSSDGEDKSRYVFKGPGFGDFLASRKDFAHIRDMFYHSVKTITSIPPHPNILPPAPILVVARFPADESHQLVCGSLYPFMSRGTLDDHVTRSKENNDCLKLRDKARWCLQLCSAVAHTHHAAHTYHMDIKPANVLVDDEGNAVLIDWEQSGAPTYTLAPEANGEWDVEEVEIPGALPRLAYTRYEGPRRVNMTFGRPAWNVFPEWSERWPRACAAAEVFSVGRTMWMLLQEVTQKDIEDLAADKIIVSWDEDTDIPECWREVVMKCMEKDPNERIKLTELVAFWEEQQI